MRFDTVIRNGTVVTATDTCVADVGIHGDKVSAVAAQLPTENATLILEPSGCLLIPGGIDVHTHLGMPFGGPTSADDFHTGTIPGAIDVIVQQALAEGRRVPRHRARTRPTTGEAEVTSRAIALAEMAGVPVYIVHLSCYEALVKVREARERGVPASAETCPQYLYL